MLQAIGTGDSVRYAPLGAVVYSKLATANKREEFILDALANRRRSITYGEAGSTDTLEYESGTGRHLATREFGLQEDSTIYLYTATGDLQNSKRYHFAGHQGFGYLTETRETDNSYTLDLKLKKSVFRLDTVATGIEPPPGYVPYRSDETYRYDALGRRIYARAVRGPNCINKDRSSGCRSTVTRTVWDGDQLLFEIRVPGDSGASLELDSYAGVHYGVVGYTHGPGIDQPLDLIKGSEVVVPHTNWRGAYDKATCPVADCGAATWLPGSASGVFGGPSALFDGPPSWYGSLIEGMTDASGYQYRRNRYYDPKTGRFTQEDPIGIAGGLNVYGFAEGDPVNYSDPFGLNPCPGVLRAVCAAGIGVAAAVSRIGPAVSNLAARAAVGTGIAVSAARALAGGNRPLPAAIARTFEGGRYAVSRLAADAPAQRVFGGGADAVGRFLTTNAPATSEAAKTALQLPTQNAATHLANVIIPQGTTIYTGTVAGSPTGATQIYVRSKDVLKLISTSPLK